jgi:photosystem II stability/assembly factor-like uncharacterized protein
MAPLLIDSRRGRIYAQAYTGPPDPVPSLLRPTDHIAVLSTVDGSVLDTYVQAGLLGLDVEHDRLYVDQQAQGLAILEATTGKLLHTVALPPAGQYDQGTAAPQADDVTGQVLVMRGSKVYFADGESGQILRDVDFELHPQDGCRSPHDMRLPIDGSHFDKERRILYVDFATYFCTPWIGLSTVAYDLAANKELGRGGNYLYSAVAANGRFFGASRYRFGVGYLWYWREGRPAFQSDDWNSDVSVPYPDFARGRLYQVYDGSLRLLDADTLSLLAVMPAPVAGSLAGFDPATDQLYFLDGGRVRPFAASQIKLPQAMQPAPATPPLKPVALLEAGASLVGAVKDGSATLIGTWGWEPPGPGCDAFPQVGGSLLLSPNGGATWAMPQAGLPGKCTFATALAVSPAYAEDRTLFAGVTGSGIFRSIDGGGLWQPASGGLPGMHVLQLALSSGFVRDRTLVAVLAGKPLQRSVDGGASWQPVGEMSARLLALSPEFDQDSTLAAYGYVVGHPGSAVGVSRDRGDHWQTLPAPVSDTGSLVLLSVAPAFAKWHVVFGLDDEGRLFRSPDGAATWQPVLNTGVSQIAGGQMAYGPDENRRTVLLLVRASQPGAAGGLSGKLFRSPDGGQTWTALNPGANLVPTAMALSPDFARDGLLYLGTADGRVLELREADIPSSD